jgi:hypothetical protein
LIGFFHSTCAHPKARYQNKKYRDRESRELFVFGDGKTRLEFRVEAPSYIQSLEAGFPDEIEEKQGYDYTGRIGKERNPIKNNLDKLSNWFLRR